MNDTRLGWNHAKIVEAFLAPFQELIALSISLEFEFLVDLDGAWGAERVDLYGVVDHQVHAGQWVDFLDIATEAVHRASKGCQVNHGRNTREILKDHATRHKRYLLLANILCFVTGERLDVLVKDHLVVQVSEARLEQNLYRIRQGVDFPELPKRFEVVCSEFTARRLDRCFCVVFEIGHMFAPLVIVPMMSLITAFDNEN